MTEQDKDKDKQSNSSSNANNLAKRGVLKINFTDEKMLYNSYMPFTKGCGIFIPDEDEHQLGDEAFLFISLPNEGGKFAVSAKVIWLNPKQKMGKRVPGIGLQILGREVDEIRKKIESILGKKISSPLPTATM